MTPTLNVRDSHEDKDREDFDKSFHDQPIIVVENNPENSMKLYVSFSLCQCARAL
jgi:hypothetical protein